MANVKISELPAATGITAADIFPAVQGGITKRAGVSLVQFNQTPSATTLASAVSSGRALIVTAGTVDLSAVSSTSVTSDLVLVALNDATLNATTSDDFLTAGGGDIIIDGLLFGAWSHVVYSPQAASGYTTSLLRFVGCAVSGAFDVLYHERQLSDAYIVGNTFDALTGVPIKIGYNNYSLQENWNNLRIIGNRATNILAASAIDHYFAQINGKHALVALNEVDTITGTGIGEVFGVYMKQRYAVVLGNNIRGLTTVGSANPCAIQLKGADRGDTGNGVQGYANLVSSNMLLGTTARGIEIHVEDVAVVGNYVEGFTFGIMPQADADGVLTGTNRIRGAAASAGNYGVHLTSSGDDQLIVGNLIDQVDRGINLAQSSERNINVVGNSIAECDGIGIQQSGTAALLSIVGNTVDGADRAIYVGGTVTRLLVVGNNFAALTDANDRAIEIDGGTSSGLIKSNAPTEVTTTDASATNLYRFQLADNTAVWVEGTIIAKIDDASERSVWKIGGLFYRDGGGAVQQGSTADLITAIQSTWGGAPPAGPAFSIDTNTVRIRGTGKLATSITWSTDYTVQII